MNLTYHIIKRIFKNLGIDNYFFGKVGITTRNHLLLEKINLENDISANMYCGIIKIDNSNITATLLDLTENNIADFVLAFQFDGSQIYLLWLTDDGQDQGDFIIKEDNKLIPATVYSQAKVLAGIEYITQQGLIWEPCQSCNELKNAIIEMIS